MNQKKTVAVIGAGISGLVCAFELQKAGYAVEVFEREKTVGGRMASRSEQELSFDIGAQIVSKSYTALLAYCDELSITKEWTELTGLTHYLYEKDKLHLASYGTLGEFLRYSYLSPTTRIRLLLFIGWLRLRARTVDFFDLTSGSAFDAGNAYDYAKRFAGQEVADKVVDALVAAYHFHQGREMSLTAFMGCLNHFTRYFTFHQLVRNMSTVPEALAKRLTVHTGTPVTDVTYRDKQLLLRTSQGERTSDLVVFATPGAITRNIYKTPSSAQQELLHSVQYASTINVSFRVATAQMGDIGLVLVPERENRYICSYMLPQKAICGTDHSLLNIFLRDQPAKELLPESNEKIFSTIKRELLTVCPPLRDQADQIQPHDLQRWPEAMPKFFPSYVRQVECFWETGQGAHNVYFCGDFLNTPWIEGSIRCGQRVAKLVHREKMV